MTSPEKNSYRFYELDTVRFLAALAVLFYHYTFSTARLLGTPASPSIKYQDMVILEWMPFL